MKTDNFGFVYPESKKEFLNTINEMYNNSEFEELLNEISLVFANSNIESTKQRKLHFLKQRKERLPVISLSNTEECVIELLNA